MADADDDHKQHTIYMIKQKTMRLESGSHHHTPIAQLHAEIRSPPPTKKNKKPHREEGGENCANDLKPLGGAGDFE